MNKFIFRKYKGIDNLLKKGYISGTTYEAVKKEIDFKYGLNQSLKKIK